MENFDCELLNAVCSGDKDCSRQMKELFKCKNCESSIHEKYKCHNLQENILTFLNSQLAHPKGVRALDCFCAIKDTTTGCRMKKKLANNFYDCHVTSTPSENQCKNLYQKCAKNGFSSICGQSLLKLMSNCSVPQNGSCNESNCIQSIGDMLFYDFDTAESASFFKCCEFEHKCNGLPWTIYSPKKCLKRSPLYSCTYSYFSCLEDPVCENDIKTVEEKCHEDFLHHNKTYCDKNWYKNGNNSQDVHDCIAATKSLERFYCSCELNKNLPYDEAIRELDECLKYRRLFTLQPCWEQEMRGLSTEIPRLETIQPVSFIIFFTLFGISILICICCCFAKPSLFKKTRRSSLRRRYNRYTQSGTL